MNWQSLRNGRTRLLALGGLLALAAALAVGIGTSRAANRRTHHAAAASGSGHLVFYSVTHGQAGSSPFWATYYKGLYAAAAKYGVTVKALAPPGASPTPTQEAELLNSAVAAHPDGLIVSYPDAQALQAESDKAISEGIPIIAVNAPDYRLAGKRIPYMFYVGENSRLAGRAMADAALNAKPHLKQGVCISVPGNQTLEERCQGWVAEMKKHGLVANTLELAPTDETGPSALQARMTAYLQANPKTDVIQTQGPVGVFVTDGTLAAIQALHLSGKITVTSTDLSTGTVKDIENGTLLATLDQQGYLEGYLPVEFLYLYKKYGFKMPANIYTGPFVINKSNVRQIASLSAQSIR